MIQKKFKVISNNLVTGKYYQLVLDAAQIGKKASPGQFVSILINNGPEPLLRRPLGIHRVKKNGSLEILYEVKGKGTQNLSQKKSGEYLDVIGPLGNGFSILDTRYSMLVAGGMGIAPLLFLAERTRIQHPASRIEVLIGAKTKNQVLCEKEFRGLGCEVKIATDNGSCEFKGYVSDLLNKELSAIRHLPRAIFACGPKPMLKEVALLAKKYHIPAQVSLEEHMACGTGVCFGCVVKTKAGYRRVCKEGPVFEANQIIWGKCFDFAQHFDSKHPERAKRVEGGQ